MDEMLLATQEWLNNTYSGRTGYVDVPEDGGEATNSRYLTYRGLVRALQIELGGLTVDGDFGNGTVTRFNTVYPNGLSQVPDVNAASPTNMGYIIQGTLWTKGYEPGGFTGIFGPNTAAAIISFQGDAGIPQNGVVRGYILQGLMNTDDYDYDGPTTGDEYYKHLVQLKLNELYWSQIGLIPPNGLWERKSHQNLIKACQIEWGQTVDGVFGTATMNAAPTLSQNTSGWTASKRLLQMALTVNGYYPGGITGTFGSGTYNAVYNFQAFACLGADGVAGKNTWASLLKSCGNPDRAGATTCDTAVRLTAQQAGYVVSPGYNTVGRYLISWDRIPRFPAICQ
jgi:peptidoglycan hydrolase-like protein with peptidoglycan-binding domain